MNDTLKLDYDWIVVGSGFGGSVSALRLTEKGYRVGVLECGRRFRDQDFAESAWQVGRFFWAPFLGLRGILRLSPFKDILVASGAAVGGGSVVYANTLYRAKPAFFRNPQWAGLDDWAAALAPHYCTAERMLGVREVPFASDGQALLKEVGEAFGVGHTFTRTPNAVFFGQAGATVPDPYFGGEGPERTGCTRCGGCLLGCRVGAKNSLLKNYLWFAERSGARIVAEREVVDIRPLGASDGADGYELVTRRPGAWLRRDERRFTARGVVLAAGALGTNRLLAHCKHRGGLPGISARLGNLVRTNSESILAVTLPRSSRLRLWNDVAISASVHVSEDTHIEFANYGRHADLMSGLTTLLVGPGTRLTRPLKLVGRILRHPVRFLQSLVPCGWSRRTIVLLVMQTLDNAIAFRTKPRWLGRKVALATEQDPHKPNPTYIEAGNRVAEWLQQRTGGFAQSGLLEALANIPVTAHILGGAVIGSDAETGVVDRAGRVFNYRNLLICDGSILPANPGVNPSLTITALAEMMMSAVPQAGRAG